MATTPRNPALIISCQSCCMQGTATCADCVVTHLLSPAPDAVTLDEDEIRVMRLLVRAGMVPTLRHSETAAATAFG